MRPQTRPPTPDGTRPATECASPLRRCRGKRTPSTGPSCGPQRRPGADLRLTMEPSTSASAARRAAATKWTRARASSRCRRGRTVNGAGPTCDGSRPSRCRVAERRRLPTTTRSHRALVRRSRRRKRGRSRRVRADANPRRSWRPWRRPAVAMAAAVATTRTARHVAASTAPPTVRRPATCRGSAMAAPAPPSPPSSLPAPGNAPNPVVGPASTTRRRLRRCRASRRCRTTPRRRRSWTTSGTRRPSTRGRPPSTRAYTKCSRRLIGSARRSTAL
mmetsp:Transcript_48518/g.149769  ORF Transcript_48518/g.149769 Transcript_48518/m.149769 type:complete len:275 (-) Transcript_48518:1582-2406(-)